MITIPTIYWCFQGSGSYSHHLPGTPHHAAGGGTHVGEGGGHLIPAPPSGMGQLQTFSVIKPRQEWEGFCWGCLGTWASWKLEKLGVSCKGLYRVALFSQTMCRFVCLISVLWAEVQMILKCNCN